MSEPGVSHSEGQSTEQFSYVFYDGAQVNTDRILALYKEKTNAAWARNIVSDQPVVK